MRLLIFLVFSQYGIACKHGIIFNWMESFHLLVPAIKIGSQARLYKKPDSIYFLNKRCFKLIYF